MLLLLLQLTWEDTESGVMRPEHASALLQVGAAAPSIPPTLVAALSPGGRMVIPVGQPNDIQVGRCGVAAAPDR